MFRPFLLLILFLVVPGLVSLAGEDGKCRRKKRPEKVILMIGDGMGLSQITAAQVSNGGRLSLSDFKNIGLISTHSGDNLITDSGAGATAFSTGEKTFNLAVGVGMDSLPRKTLLEMASMRGLSTGLVVTSSLTHATPASFIAHQPSRLMYEEIASDFLKTDVDVLIGGGRRYFDRRKDGRNLVDSLIHRDFRILDGVSMLAEVRKGKVACFTSDLEPESLLKGRDGYLPAASKEAVRLLDLNKKGFFAMIEGSQIDWGGHAKDQEYLVSELLEFDRAVGEMLEFAKKDGKTLLIVTADHETGGMALTEGSYPKREVKGKFVSALHTGTMVPLYAYGPGAEEFCGTYDNTDVFHKIKKLLRW